MVRAKTGQTVISIEDIDVSTYETDNSVTGLCKRLMSLNETLNPEEEGEKSDPQGQSNTEYQYLNGRLYYLNIRTAGVDNLFSLYWCSTSVLTPSPDYTCASSLTETGEHDEVDIRFYILSEGAINVVPLMFEPHSSPVTYSFAPLTTAHELPVDLADLCAIYQQCAFDEYGLYFAFGQKAFHEDDSFSSATSLGSAYLGGTTQVGAGVSLSVPSAKTVVVDGPIDGAGDSQFEVSGRLVVLPASSIDGTKIVVQPGGSVVMEAGEHAIDAGAGAYQYHDLVLVKPGAVVRVKESSVVSFGAWARVRIQGTNGLDLAPGTIFEFGDRAELVIEGDFDATNVTFTSAYVNPTPSTGWGGITFKPGSSGTIDGSLIEGVGGYGWRSIGIENASPTITGSTVRNSAGLGIHGLYISGSSAAPHIEANLIQNHSGTGISMIASGGGAYVHLVENVILNNQTVGVSAGFGTNPFLSPPYGSTPGIGNFGNIIEGNTGGGLYASMSAYVNMGWYYYVSGGGYHADGFNSLVGNGAFGAKATSAASIAGGGTTAQRYNRLFSNATYDAEATGSGSRIYARCAWWNDTTPPFNTTASSGGLLYNNYYLLQDPFVNPTATCTSGGGPMPRMSPNAGAAGTESSASSDRADFVQAVESAAESPDWALGEFERLATSSASDVGQAALAEIGFLMSRRDVEPGIRADAEGVLERTAAEEHGELRAGAIRSLVAGLHRRGEIEAAIVEAHLLLSVAPKDEYLLYAHVALAHLYASADREIESRNSLAAARAIEADAVETQLAATDIDARFGVSDMDKAPHQDFGPAAEPPSADLTNYAEVELVAFPNPVRHVADLRLWLRDASSVRIVLYDMLGRQVDLIVDATFGSGKHAIALDASNLPAGVYMLRALSNGSNGFKSVATRSITVLN